MVANIHTKKCKAKKFTIARNYYELMVFETKYVNNATIPLHLYNELYRIDCCIFLSGYIP